MQGLVTIDFGNSNPHAALFLKSNTEWQLIKVVPWAELNLFLTQLGMSPNNSSMVLCEVKSRDEDLSVLQQQGWLITRVKDYWRGNSFAGMLVNYSRTLGEDRLISAFYAYKKIKSNVLLIDAGTYVTMDVVTSKGFEGGYIIPSLEIYQSGFQKGQQLKEVALDQDISNELPHGTQEAMRDSYFAFAALAQKLVSEHNLEKIIITGGQSALWEQIFGQLKAPAVVEVDPALIHWALHFWMKTQIEPL